MAAPPELISPSWCFSSQSYRPKRRRRKRKLVYWSLMQGPAHKMVLRCEGDVSKAPPRSPATGFLRRLRLLPRSTGRSTKLARLGGDEDDEQPWVPFSGPLNLHSQSPRLTKHEVFIPRSGQLVVPSSSSRAASKLVPPRSRSARHAPPAAASSSPAWRPLADNWHEVVSMVLSKDLDNLVDLEEFFGYYHLLTCPAYREIVEQVFKEFCSDFSLPVASLMVPAGCKSYRGSSDGEGEVECLPPSPCSKQTLSWITHIM